MPCCYIPMGFWSFVHSCFPPIFHLPILHRYAILWKLFVFISTDIASLRDFIGFTNIVFYRYCIATRFCRICPTWFYRYCIATRFHRIYQHCFLPILHRYAILSDLPNMVLPILHRYAILSDLPTWFYRYCIATRFYRICPPTLFSTDIASLRDFVGFAPHSFTDIASLRDFVGFAPHGFTDIASLCDFTFFIYSWCHWPCSQLLYLNVASVSSPTASRL